METAKEWIQLVLSTFTLLAIVVGGWKVISIAERGVEDHRARLGRLESDVSNINLALLQLTGVKTEVADMHGEVIRMRDRLDKFLDIQAKREAPPIDSMSSVVELLTEVLKRKTISVDPKVSIEP